MKYDFDKVINRRNTKSYKWDAGDFFFPECPEALPLWVADMDFPCPDPIVKAIQERAAHPVYGYAFTGDECKLPAIAWQKRRNNWDISAEQVTFSNGVVPALCTILQAFTEKGDSVIVQTPVYYPFMETIESNGRKVEENSLIYENGSWKMNLEEFERLAERPETKLFMLCNPHNPIGRVFTSEELEAVGRICVKHHVLIASDEIHSDLVFSGFRHVPIASLSEEIGDITITAFSTSKTFNVAGLQASVIVAKNQKLLKKFEEEMQKDFFVMNLFGSVALQAAYQDCEDYLEQLLDYIWNNYLYVDHFLKTQMPKIKCQKPEGTYLLWLDCRELGLNAEGLNEFFLKKAKVAFDNGEWFGGDCEQFMRLNIGCPRKTLEKCMKMIKEAYDREEY